MKRGTVFGRVLRWTGAGLTLGAIAGAGAYTALGASMPRYAAETLYEVLPPASTRSSRTSIGPGERVEMDSYMETQVSVLVSDRVLEKAVNAPEVAATEWARRATINGKYTPQLALKELRPCVSASIIPDTNLIRFEVETPDPTDAASIAGAIDEVFRRDNLRVSTQDARGLEDDIERKIRERRQDVAALDLRIENIINQNDLTVLTVEQSAPYLERSLVLSQLADARLKLATLPPTPEGETPSEERQTLERVESSLRDRLGTLNNELNEATRAIAEMRNLQFDRALKMDQIGAFEQIVADLGLEIEQGSRIRVLSPPSIPDERSFPPLWPLIGLGAAVFGALGLLTGLLRQDP